MNILNLNLVDNGIDQKVIELLSKSMPQEDLEKALNRSGLVQRIVQVKTKHGIVNRKQWVRASELKQPEKPRKKTAVEIEELAIEGAKLPKIYGKTIRDLTPQQIEDLNNIAVPRARMTALKNLIGEEGSTKWALELGLKWKHHPDSPEQDWKNARRAIKRYFIAGNKIHVPDGNTKVEPKAEPKVEPKKTEPKVDDTKKEEPKKAELEKFETVYKDKSEIPERAIRVSGFYNIIKHLSGKEMVLVGTYTEKAYNGDFTTSVLRDEWGKLYRVSSLMELLKSGGLQLPKLSTHKRREGGGDWKIATTYKFDSNLAYKEPPEKVRDFEKVDKSVMTKKSMAFVKAGEPMRFEDANSCSVNPHIYDHDLSAEDYKDYCTNCQTCVAVFEARLRGYDIVARKRDDNSVSEGYMHDLSHDTLLAWDEKQRNSIILHEKGSRDKPYSWMDKTINNGERYHFRYANIHGDSGHIVTAYKDDDGEVVIYDPQDGEHIKGKSSVERYFKKYVKTSGARVLEPTLYRVDNLKFNFKIMNEIAKGASE